MSSDRRPPAAGDDVDDADVSRAWKSTQAAQPPSRVDDAVLQFARAAQVPLRAKRRWQAPLALAAVLALGFGVVLQLWREPQVRVPQPQSAAAPAAAPVVEPPPPTSRPKPESASDEARQAQSAAAGARKREEAAKRSLAAVSRERDAAAAAAEMQRDTEHERAAASPPPPPPSPPGIAEDVPPESQTAPASPAPADARFEAMPPAQKALAPAPAVMVMRPYGSTMRPEHVVASLWQPARFQNLPLLTTTRAQLRQRYGEPASTPAQRVDRYDQVSDLQGPADFEYDDQSRLVRVQLQLPQPPSVSAWTAQQNWPEPPLQRAADWACEGGDGRGATAAGKAIWVYPARGAWLVLDAEQRVVQVNYAAGCE